MQEVQIPASPKVMGSDGIVNISTFKKILC